jgi:hypothetical protein
MVRKECMKKFLQGVIAPSFGAMQNDSMSFVKGVVCERCQRYAARRRSL